MADSTEELLQEIKEILSGMKDISKFSKDLSEAVGASTRPMQQMSDYTKAMSEQMEDMAKNFGDTNDSMQSMISDTNDLALKMKEMVQVSKDAELAATAARQAYYQQREELTKQQTILASMKVSVKEREEVERGAHIEYRNRQALERAGLESTLGLWEKISKAAKSVSGGFAGYGYEVNPITGEASKMGFDAARPFRSAAGIAARGGAAAFSGGMDVMFGGGLVDTMKSSLGKLTETAGVGGLIGMMISGKIKDEDFRAIGEKAAQQFDNIGGHTEAFAGRLGNTVRTLSVYGMATKESLGEITKAFAESGISARDAESHVAGFYTSAGKGIPANLITATLSLDKAFEMAEGTAAKFVGTLSKDFNMSTDAAYQNLVKMANAAKETGQSVSVFMAQTMQASSALRLMHANQSAVIDIQVKAAQAGQSVGLNSAFAGQRAVAGAGQIAGAIGGGMNEGVMALLGQRLFGGDALDALYKLKSPQARGGGELDTERVVREMGNIMKESGVTGLGAQYKFAEGVFGLGAEGAEALMAAMNEQKTTGKVSADTQKKIADALGHESNKSNQLLLAVEIIKDAIANAMVGLLKLIVNGLELLYRSVASGLLELRAEFADFSSTLLGIKGDPEKAAELRVEAAIQRAYIKPLTNNVTSNINTMVAAGKKAYSATKHQAFNTLTDGMFPDQPNVSNEMIEYKGQKISIAEFTKRMKFKIDIKADTGNDPTRGSYDASGGGTPPVGYSIRE